MSTEKSLAVSHPGFWQSVLPLSEAFVRTLNRSLDRFVPPMKSSIAAARRGLINECGFRIFAASVVMGREVSALDPQTLDEGWSQAVAHVRTMREFGRTPLDPIARPGELDEAFRLAKRTALFFTLRNHASIKVQPTFSGCGWLDESRGDVLVGNTLFEIKAGDRNFLGVDVFQLLTYCALNFATKTYDIIDVGLLNPRTGNFIVLNLDELCMEAAGSSTADVLNEILQFVSEPLGGYAR